MKVKNTFFSGLLICVWQYEYYMLSEQRCRYLPGGVHLKADVFRGGDDPS